MTIEEAIAHAREVAEEKYRDASMYVDDNGLYAKEYAKCRFCAEEHEQLAEWLKELKELRETTFNYTKMLDARYEQGKIDGINKFVVNAITEFQKFDKEHGYPTLRDISVILSDVAEQLKEQKNE